MRGQEPEKTLRSRRFLASRHDRQASVYQSMAIGAGSLVPLQATRSGSVSSPAPAPTSPSAQPTARVLRATNYILLRKEEKSYE